MEPLTHCPWLLHDCGVTPEHRVAPETHTPTQDPLEQVLVVHVVPFVQVPDELHVWVV